MSLVPVLTGLGEWILTVLVLLGAVPLVAACGQFLLIGLHRYRSHYDRTEPYLPRVAILVPAWNEAAVLETSIDRLVELDYPPEALRVYVVDDASTDGTPEVLRAKAGRYPGRIVHLRREKGGEGKAHTLNHGLAVILADDWMQALLIMDADVVYERDALRRMTRHLADPEVGAVTAYIKEGSAPGNYLSRFIAFEYATAQAAQRRSQNVLGVMACLAGGAQLHSRTNLEALGGRIDTSSLAEDTFTTFNTQLRGARVVFEGNAVAWAEEPATVGGLWKQRLRWARGNVQVTSRFRRLWFRPSRVHRLGSVFFGIFWFSLFLQPVFMISSSAGLVVLFFTAHDSAYAAFRLLWLLSLVTYLFVTSFTLAIDPAVARRSWFEATLFPGAVSLLVMAAVAAPSLASDVLRTGYQAVGLEWTDAGRRPLILFAYCWTSACMLVAYLGRVVEGGRLKPLAPLFVYLGGYGPLLCAVTFASYVKELRGAAMTWDKTEKTGKVVAPR
jgi:cellulose synthase/poly-beta-1,6-N-acetylglucosamine synthase-like glycosyltransferase